MNFEEGNTVASCFPAYLLPDEENEGDAKNVDAVAAVLLDPNDDRSNKVVGEGDTGEKGRCESRPFHLWMQLASTLLVLIGSVLYEITGGQAQ